MTEDNIELLRDENIRLKAKLEAISCKDSLGLIETFVEEKIRLQIENQRLKIRLEKLEQEKEFIEYEDVEKVLDTHIEDELKELKRRYKELSLAYDDLLSENDFLEKKLEDKQSIPKKIETNEIKEEETLVENFSDVIDIETNEKSDNSSEIILKNEENTLESFSVNESEEEKYDFSDLFKQAKVELSEEKLIIDQSKRLLPMGDFYSKEEIEKNKSIFLEQIKYFSENRNALKSEELFKFLVSFTFYFYREGNLWTNLMNFLEIEEDYGNTLRDYVKEISDTNNYILIKNELSSSNEIVETLKLHARIPLFYLGSFLQDLYQIYIKLGRNINKEIFFSLLEERIGNDGHLSNLNTVKNLYKYGQRKDLFDFSYNLLSLIDKIDRNIDYDDVTISDEIKKETKLWYETDYKYAYKSISNERFDNNKYKEPKISLDFIRNKIKMDSFNLPLEEIEELYLKIYSFKDKIEESRKINLNYFQNSEKYEVRREEISITKEEMLGRYEIYLNNSLIYEKNISFLLINEFGEEIKSIKTLENNKFTLVYLKRYYEVLSEAAVEIEEYTGEIDKVDLNKENLNYLRNRYNQKTVLNLTSRVTKEVGILFPGLIDNFSVDSLKVVTAIPMIHGFSEEEHSLFFNGKRIQLSDLNTHIIGKNSLRVFNKNTNRVMKEENYIYIPDLYLGFCFYDKTDKARPYIYGEFDEAFVEISSKHINTIYGLDESSYSDNFFKINIVEDEAKKGTIEFSFNLNNSRYRGEFIIPKLVWSIENKEYSGFLENLWREELSYKKFKFNLSGVNTFSLHFVDKPLEMSSGENRIDFVQNLINFSKKDKELFRIKFLYKGKKYSESLFNLVLRPVIEEEQFFLIHSYNNADKYQVICQNMTIEEKPLNPNEFFKLAKDSFSGEGSINLIKEDMFGFDSEVIYSKPFILNKEDINPGDKFQVTNLVTKEGEIVEVDGEIIFEFLYLDEHKNIIAKVLHSTKEIYHKGERNSMKSLKISYNFDYTKLTATYIKVVGKDQSIPLRYLLGTENKLRAFEISPSDKGENANYKLIFKKI